MKAWRAKIYGLVQNVGFRASVKRKALEKELVGTVRNLPDGGVEIVLIGEKALLEDLLQAMQEGCWPWRIDRVVFESLDSQHPHHTFQIIRD